MMEGFLYGIKFGLGIGMSVWALPWLISKAVDFFKSATH